MSTERYEQFFLCEPDGLTLRPGGKAEERSFTASPKKGHRYRLFTIGETEQFYFWKDEPDGPLQYRTITDSLDEEHAKKDRFCLDFSSARPEQYIRRIYKKVIWRPVLSYLPMSPVPTAWRIGIRVSGKDLALVSGGFLRLRLDIRLKKEGVGKRSVAGGPDESILLDLPLGTYEQTEIAKDIEIPENTAHVGVFVEGRGYRGECYLEHPFLSAAGQNLLPAFSDPVPDCEHFEWTGQYLSRKEWPVFRVRLNGKTVFKGEIFERSHRHSEWEIELPRRLLLEGENRISYELLSDYHDPTPYTVYEAGLIEETDGPLTLVAVSETAHVGGKVRILVRTSRAHTRVKLTPTHAALEGEREYVLEEPGLHGLTLKALSCATNATFRLTVGRNILEAIVPTILERGEDRVITGTGDAIYVRQDDRAMEDYLSWYFSSHVGDLVTIRPNYRWSGTRTLNSRMWKWVVRLLDELEVKYVLMMDGRELPGLSTQPWPELAEGRGFLGRQTHEYDGRQFYWGQGVNSTLTMEQYDDLVQLSYEEDPLHTSFGYNSINYFPNDRTVLRFTDRESRPKDYLAAHKASVELLKATRHPSDLRHTGPACTFKYFIEAGYTWLGAETMYSTMEPLLGFLRATAKDAGHETWGVHHALQWSSSPHEDEGHYRRYRLALYASYMLGATDINTEEGLWHLEEYYEHHHRFSTACRMHLLQQQDFYRYVTSHTRSGRFHTPFAILHGRDDGSNFFVRKRIWGIAIPESDAEQSWQMIKTIYPQALPGQCVYVHGCPSDRPQGYHTATPFGNADMPPAEASLKTLADYRSMLFLSYHRMTEEDAEKLYAYVQNGGRLLLTRAHLTDTTDMGEIRRGTLHFSDHALSFSSGEARFAASAKDGTALPICVNPTAPDEVLSTTDDGHPLLCRYRIGNGEVLLFNTPLYPAHPAICNAYEQQMKALIRRTTDEEKVWAEVGEDLSFTVYRQEDGSTHLYFLAVDWYHDPKQLRHATLRLDTKRYDVSLPFGVLVKCVTDGERAAWATDENGEVLNITAQGVEVQGRGIVEFAIAQNGTVTYTTCDFSAHPHATLPL